jgi:hypothetical protein
MKTKEQPMSRTHVIESFSRAYGMNICKLAKSIRVRVDDHTANAFAPEAYCYKISFSLFGDKKRFAFWPNTVGLQGC